MVVRRTGFFGFWWQRQSIARGRQPQSHRTCPSIYGSHGCGQGHCMVSSSTRTLGQRGRNSRSLHSVLEHFERFGTQLRRYRQSGVQPGMVTKLQRDCQHPWIFPQPDRGVALPQPEQSCHSDRAHLPSLVSGHVSGRIHDRYGSWRRNPAILASLSGTTVRCEEQCGWAFVPKHAWVCDSIKRRRSSSSTSTSHLRGVLFFCLAARYAVEIEQGICIETTTNPILQIVTMQLYRHENSRTQKQS
mmetsp:Transcript_2592/g.5632  ORF Transcript_2592/g.5632 Transcript_2592/m.5632 type:complete len:245 (+) Transcript_2592:2232-2966(+)